MSERLGSLDNPIEVLLIEDNPDDARLIEFMLSEAPSKSGARPIRLSVAPDFSTGLAHLEEGSIDVTLLDLGLPETTGLETLNRYCQVSPETTVVVLTGYDDDEFALQAVRSGAEDYLVKTSLTPDSLIRTIQYAHERQLSRQALKASEARYRTLFEGVPVGLYRTTPRGEILDINQALVKMLGFPDREAALKTRSGQGYLDPKDRPRWQSMMDARGVVENFVSQWLRQDGTSIWVEESAHAVRDDHGDLLYYEGAVKDISERRRAEMALFESERRLATLMGNLPGIAYRCKNDPEWTMEFVSQGCKALTGYAPEQLIDNADLSYAELIDPRDRQYVWDHVQESVGEGRTFQLQYRIITADDVQRWVWEQGQYVFDDRGEIIALEGFITDITERVHARLALEESEERYRRLVENMDDLIYRYEFEPERRFSYVSPSATRITGYTPEEHYADPDLGFKLVHPDDRHLLEDQDLSNEELRTPRVLRWKRKDGELIWTEQRNIPIYDEAGNLVALEGIARDITEQVEAREALRESEELQLAMIAASPLAIFSITMQGEVLFWTDAAERMFGWPAEEVTGKPLPIIPPGKEDEFADLRRRASSGEPPTGVELVRLHKDGRLIDVSLSTALMHDENSVPIGVMSIMEDISLRKMAETALRDSEERYRLLAETTPDIIILHDMQGNILYVNQAGLDFSGYSPEEWIGRPLTDLIPEEHSFEIAARRTQRAAGDHQTYRYEVEFIDKLDRRVPVEIHSTPVVHDGTVNSILIVARNITERKQMERALIESEEKFREIFNNANDSMYLYGLTEEGMPELFLEVNEVACQMLGYSYDEFLQMSPRDIVDPHSEAENLAIMEQLLKHGHATFESQHLKKDGSVVPVEISSHLFTFHDRRLVLSITRDVTERKRAEQEIRRTVAQLHSLHEIDKTISAILDLDEMLAAILNEITRIVRCDSMSLQILDKNQLEIIAGQGFEHTSEVLRLTFPLDPKFPNYRVIQERVPVAHEDVSREYPHFEEEAAQFDSGHIRSWLGVPLITGDELIGMLTFDRKTIDPFDPQEIEIATMFAAQAAIALQNAQLYEETKNSEANYRGIFEGIQDAIYVEARDGSILDVNERACELYGYTREDFLGLNAAALAAEEPASSPARDDLLPTGGTKTPFVSVHRRADGRDFPVEISMRFQDVAGERVKLVVVRDISERKQAEEQIRRHIDRLEALRQIDLAITQILDLEETLSVFLKHLTAQLHVDAACVLLLNPENRKLEFATSHGFDSEALRYTSLALGEGCAGKSAQSKTTYFIADLADEPEVFKGSKYFHEEGFKSYYAIPLLSRDEVSGVIEIFHRSRMEPDDEWKQFLEMLATQAALAIENATFFTKLQEHSDELEVAVENATLDLRESRDQLKAILDNSPDAVLLLSPGGEIERANQAILKLFGRDPDRLTGLHINELLEGELAESIAAYFGNIPIEKPAIRLDGFTLQQDGSSIDVEIVLAPILHKLDVSAVVCSIRDVTAWQELQRMKDAFVSNVSHELRTPITSLRLNYSLLRRDPQNTDKYLDRLDREIGRLNELIEDLLRLSRLDSGMVELHLEAVNLNQLTGTTVQDRALLASANDLELAHKPDPEAITINGDSNLLGQALSVFLTNAINYTPAGGYIEVGVVKSTDSEGNWTGFYVQDDGPGIAPEDLPHLFDRFYRGTAGRTSGAPGTGLGLAIAHEIVRRHHGRIEVESEGVPGEGACFTVWLPVGEHPSSAEQGESK